VDDIAGKLSKVQATPRGVSVGHDPLIFKAPSKRQGELWSLLNGHLVIRTTIVP